MIKIIKYSLLDILRSKVVIAWSFLLFIISVGLFTTENEPDKATLGILNIVLLAVPLVSLVFSTIHLYNSFEFIELLMSQPIRRSTIILGEFAGVCTALCLSQIIGIGIPILIYNPGMTGAALLLSSLFLTIVFVSLAFFASAVTKDKAKGIGLSLMIWFYFAMIYDAMILSIIYSFSEYPIEKPVIILTTLNPIDLARIFVLLGTKMSALMAFSGAVFQEYFGSSSGAMLSVVILLAWMVIPLGLAVRIFNRKNI